MTTLFLSTDDLCVIWKRDILHEWILYPPQLLFKISKEWNNIFFYHLYTILF